MKHTFAPRYYEDKPKITEEQEQEDKKTLYLGCGGDNSTPGAASLSFFFSPSSFFLFGKARQETVHIPKVEDEPRLSMK